ncbi:MAG: flagellar basal body-associated FliL family protein [Lachnospiraceae bacterium]|nr:flagellar basal body-associated FliL family protein [Lachnospiraceae bacterium]
MKKNLLSIVILSLLVVNIILTCVMMFSVMSTNKKTAAIVTDIAGILKLELDGQEGGESGEIVAMADTAVYQIPDQMTIPCKKAEGDAKDSYCLVKVAFSMNTKDEDYEKYGTAEAMAANEALIKSEVIAVISSYTVDEIKLDQDHICDEILERVQKLYDGSNFIYKVSFSDIMFG